MRKSIQKLKEKKIEHKKEMSAVSKATEKFINMTESEEKEMLERVIKGACEDQLKILRSNSKKK